MPQNNYNTDIYRIDGKESRNVIWLEKILIKEGEIEYTERYRQVNRKEFRELVRQGRIHV